MAVVYDTDLCYCTEQDFLDAAGLRSIPADGDPPDGNAVHRLAQKVSGLVSELTGLTPPASEILPASRMQVVVDATAIGTAFRYRWGVFQRTRKVVDKRALTALVDQVDSFFGKGAASGGLVKPGTGSWLGDIGKEVGGANRSSSDVSTGRTLRPEFPATPPTAKAPFQVRKPD